jgi:hypothetical protein
MEAGGNLHNQILGNISYGLISNDEACLDIEILMNKDQFKAICRERESKRALIMAIDRSGSMSSYIGGVRDAGVLFGQKYYAMLHNENVKMRTLLYDDQLMTI